MTGYKIPPKNSQFSKGKSGNPKGRPKRKTLIQDSYYLLSDKVVITEGGKRIKVTRQELIVRQLIHLAAKGNISAIKLIIEMTEKSDFIMESKCREVRNFEPKTVEEAWQFYKSISGT